MTRYGAPILNNAQIDIIDNIKNPGERYRYIYIIDHIKMHISILTIGSFMFCVDHKIKEGQKKAKIELILATSLVNNFLAIK